MDRHNGHKAGIIMIFINPRDSHRAYSAAPPPLPAAECSLNIRLFVTLFMLVITIIFFFLKVYG